MTLQSKLFRGDTKLQLTSTSDPDHVLFGSVGPHVQKIQLALTVIDYAVIDRGELDSSAYGSSTARAVLTYKQKRNIINRSYQTQADNIVGRMTIASLDREMLAKEASSYPACNYGPKVPHPILAFVVGGFRPAPAPGQFPPPPPPPPPQMFLVLKSLPDAQKLVQSTLDILEAVASGSMTPADNAALATKALQTHYLCTTAELDHTAKDVKDLLNSVAGVLRRGSTVFVPGVQGDPDGSNAYAYSRTPRDHKVYVNPEFSRLAEFGRKLILVHESFHFLGEDIVDFCRNPDNDAGRTYRAVPKNLRRKNAYSLSQFVLHISQKAEKTLDVENDTIADLAPP